MRMALILLATALASYVDTSKFDLSSFSVTSDNIIGLVDKIGKIYTIDTNVYDKLPELDGEDLSFGKAVEEWQLDMTMPADYNEDSDGNARALGNYAPTHRPVSYSLSLGKKIFPTSIPYNNIERAVHNEGQFIEVVAMITKKLEDSIALWKYGIKRELIGKAIAKIESAYSGATAYVANSTALVEGSYYKSGTEVAVAMKAKAASADTWATCKAQGDVVVLQLINEVAVPVDDTTGEAFIEAVKKCVEKAKDVSEGFSFNGNVLGVEETLRLYVKHGIMPTLEVTTLSGAFHREELGFNVEAKPLKDFGSYSGTAYAILMDTRAIRLFQDYNGTFNQENGYGARMNYFRHLEFTGHLSRNAFITIFKPGA